MVNFSDLITPDTLIVFTHSNKGVDYTPMLSGVVASILVAGMAWWSTRKQQQISAAATTTQRQIAEEATRTQRQIAEETITAQRQIAAEGFTTQLELGRRQHVIESRREWIRGLREATAAFEEKALGLREARLHPDTSGPAKRAELRSEVLRLSTLIVLHLDLAKEEHRAIVRTLNGVMGWAQTSGQLPPEEEDEGESLQRARLYPSFIDASKALDAAVRVVIEGAWQKIRRGE